MELLLQEYGSSIRINDISSPVNTFWWSVLRDTERLRKLIRELYTKYSHRTYKIG